MRGSPVSDALGKTIASLDKVSGAVTKLQASVRERMLASMDAKKTGKADDVQQAIRSMLKAKLVDDKIEGERHKRMMDMAESLFPQVSEEQLKAVRMQQLVYREHKKTLDAELNLTKKRYDLQKKEADEMRKRRVKDIESSRAKANFALSDKYGTIESAIAGLGGSGGDTFGKFLVGGLGRFVKERREAPLAEAIKSSYDLQVQRQNDIAESKKSLADKAYGFAKENMDEGAAVRAARQGIADPGSASKLYATRNQQVASLAKVGESLEAGLAGGKYQFKLPGMERAVSDVANALRGKGSGVVAVGETPVITKDSIKRNTLEVPEAIVGGAGSIALRGKGSGVVAVGETPVITKDSIKRNTLEVPEAIVGGAGSIASTLKAGLPQRPPEAVIMPKNSKMRKAPRQSSSLLTPATKKPGAASNSVAAAGGFGGKTGAVNLSGLGTALGGISSKMATVASSAVKFLGPWGLAANSLMSLDRLVPIFSSSAGALMDLTKLSIPLLGTALVEGFAGLMDGLNTIVNVMPGTKNLEKDKRTRGLTDTYRADLQAQADVEYGRWLNTKKAIIGNDTSVVNTTSARTNRAARTGVTMYRREMSLTTPAEQAAVTAQTQAMSASTATLQDTLAANMQEQREQNRAMREAVIAASKNPGTTPIMTANPALAPFVV